MPGIPAGIIQHRLNVDPEKKPVQQRRRVFQATDKCLPFFKTLKKAFTWTEECETAFQELKHYLNNPLLLSPSKEGEDLFFYLAISVTVFSATLIREENKV